MCGLLSSFACHAPGPQSASITRQATREPAWQDALEAPPKLVVMLRPKALRADAVYGPMVRKALGLALQQRVTSRALVLEAIEDADEVIASLSDWTPSEPAEASGSDDLVLILRGTRADIDPAKLVGPQGELLWSAGPTGPVRELVHERDRDGSSNPASLFELPDRTWVVASGAARDRARDAFAHPTHRSPPSFAPEALASVRIDGPSLVSRVSVLQPSSSLAHLGHGLRSVTLDLLAPGAPAAGASGGPSVPRREVRAVVSYAEQRAAAMAATTIAFMLQAVGRTKPEGLAWLGDSRVDATGTDVIVTDTVPVDLLASVLRAGRSPPPSP
jgi:hypothetical protein